MKFSKHAWHVDPLDSFNHVWPSNRKGNWAAKEMLPNIEVELNRTNFELIFIEFFEYFLPFRIKSRIIKSDKFRTKIAICTYASVVLCNLYYF